MILLLSSLDILRLWYFLATTEDWKVTLSARICTIGYQKEHFSNVVGLFYHLPYCLFATALMTASQSSRSTLV
jgi:hypothetical protein